MRQKILCTFSGKFGDILWSLPTVRLAAQIWRHPVALGIMPQYESICAMLSEQPYIDMCIPIRDWVCVGSPHGDQPWEAPVPTGLFDQVYHLTYRAHPGIGGKALPLIDFIADQQGWKLEELVVPFIFMPKLQCGAFDDEPVVAYAFNDMYGDLKSQFLERLKARLAGQAKLVDIRTMPWLQARDVVSRAKAFVGCRSACWVLAYGCGVQTYTFEPHPARHESGNFGRIFGCPYGLKELSVPLAMTAYPQQAADLVVTDIQRQWEMDKVVRYWHR